MSISVYYGYYPKECNNTKIIPYLSKDYGMYFNGNCLDKEFYDECRLFSTERNGNCYVFEDYNSLLDFASLECIPKEMKDYILYEYASTRKYFVFLLWVC